MKEQQFSYTAIILKHDTKKMGKSALTPQQVVNNNLTFAIPIYQRLFAWSEDQILPLLLDLLYSCVKTRESHYYIGLLTTKNQDLVDGQ